MGRTRTRTAGIAAMAAPVVLLGIPESPTSGQVRSPLECARRKSGNWGGRRPDVAGELGLAFRPSH